MKTFVLFLLLAVLVALSTAFGLRQPQEHHQMSLPVVVVAVVLFIGFDIFGAFDVEPETPQKEKTPPNDDRFAI
ncbi:hypothetical protein QR680_018420 [Steinernema hermaphroditum]|uniref:Uncharacterized protein n=1 Tax=Steinernema hermaphroditum TaxID=289476 RepID=A0AA39LQQ6_9BILA|nr:hypothetical protein QR680_018420 [Steinernema hermaphroditum]